MSSHFKGRREDPRLLTGTGCFTADWNLPGQVHAAFLRSDRAYARIRAIDTSAARALPGVLAVLTGDDVRAAGYKPLPSNAPGPGYKGSTFHLPERHGLAQGRVRFVGEAVALAVAETAAIAQDACELIEVDYEDLPVVTTPVGGIPCLVESGRNGLLVPPRDPQKLADAIGTLLRDEPLRRRMGLENQRQIEREHDLEHVWPRVAAMLTG